MNLCVYMELRKGHQAPPLSLSTYFSEVWGGRGVGGMGHGAYIFSAALEVSKPGDPVSGPLEAGLQARTEPLACYVGAGACTQIARWRGQCCHLYSLPFSLPVQSAELPHPPSGQVFPAHRHACGCSQVPSRLLQSTSVQEPRTQSSALS